MTGPAGQYVLNEPIVSISDYGEFKNALLKRFYYIHPVVQLRQLNACNQNSEEDPSDYAARLQTIADNLFSEMFADYTQKAVATSLYETQIKGQYLSGLKDPIGQRVRSRDPPKFKDAIQIAVQETENEKISENNLFKIRGIEDKSTELSAVLQRLSQIEARLTTNAWTGGKYIPPMPRYAQTLNPQPRQDKSNATCHRCEKMGHYARDCLAKVKCYNCQKFGHVSSNCRLPKGSKNGQGDKGEQQVTSTVPQNTKS